MKQPVILLVLSLLFLGACARNNPQTLPLASAVPAAAPALVRDPLAEKFVRQTNCPRPNPTLPVYLNDPGVPHWESVRQFYLNTLEKLKAAALSVPVDCQRTLRPLFGVNSHATASPLQAALLDRAQLKIVRRTIYWYQVERPDGTLNETILENYRRELIEARAHGTSLIYVVHGRMAGLLLANRLEAYARFASFMERLAVALPDAKYFQLFNEMDVGWTEIFGGLDATVPMRQRGIYYGQMLNLVAPRLRAASAWAKIIIGGLAANTETDFLEGIYEAGAKDSFDAVAIQPYGVPVYWGLPVRYLIFRQAMGSHGDADKPLLVTETGISGSAMLQAWGLPTGDLGNFIDAQQKEQLGIIVKDTHENFIYDAVIFYALVVGEDPERYDVSRLPAGLTPDDFGFGLLRRDAVTPRPFFEWLTGYLREN